jgi:hypothetical protein
VAAWLEHEPTTMEVEPSRCILALLQDVAAARLREAFQDQAHRFAASVHLDVRYWAAASGMPQV